MSNELDASGSCLCGAVRFTAAKASKHLGACHCGMSRKWGGGPLMAEDCGDEVAFEGEENVAVFDSSDWAERGFCRQCGSHLFYRLKKNGIHIIPAGLFDNQESFVFEHQIFIDHKPPYYCFENETRDMTEAEVFARYGA